MCHFLNHQKHLSFSHDSKNVALQTHMSFSQDSKHVTFQKLFTVSDYYKNGTFLLLISTTWIGVQVTKQWKATLSYLEAIIKPSWLQECGLYRKHVDNVISKAFHESIWALLLCTALSVAYVFVNHFLLAFYFLLWYLSTHNLIVLNDQKAASITKNRVIPLDAQTCMLTKSSYERNMQDTVVLKAWPTNQWMFLTF